MALVTHGIIVGSTDLLEIKRDGHSFFIFDPISYTGEPIVYTEGDPCRDRMVERIYFTEEDLQSPGIVVGNIPGYKGNGSAEVDVLVGSWEELNALSRKLRHAVEKMMQDA